jgi:biotin transporter BioY
LLIDYVSITISMILACIIMYVLGLLWFTDKVNRQVKASLHQALRFGSGLLLHPSP